MVGGFVSYRTVVDVRIEDGPGQFGMFVVGLGFDFFWVCGGLSGHVIVAGVADELGPRMTPPPPRPALTALAVLY